MKAIVFNEHGGPEKLILAEFPDPIAEAGEVVISVKACGLNHVDLWVLQGNPNYPVSKPHALGSDVSGVVISKGRISRFRCQFFERWRSCYCDARNPVFSV